MAEAARDSLEMLRTVLDALPSLVFVVDPDLRVQHCNAAAARLLAGSAGKILNRRTGDLMHCLHARDVPAGCGRGPSCRDCVIRRSASESFQGQRVTRRRVRMVLVDGDGRREFYALVSTAPFVFEGRSLVLLVIEDLSELAELQRLIPICSVCRKVRDDRETWTRVETYFRDRWDVDFSHGLCPECLESERAKLREDGLLGAGGS
jgi:PAS domain-containing protein